MDFFGARKFNTLNDYYQKKYGKKVFKVSLNGGFTCPNKDGVSGIGGCIYCSELGSGDYAGNPDVSLKIQYDAVKAQLSKKWPDAYTIAYFQANTNTYKPIKALKQLYDQALTLDSQMVGLSIATRCDALSEPVLDLLTHYRDQTDLQIELGLQTMHEATAKWINRGHDLACFEHAVKALRGRNIDVVVHIINGLKNETPTMMLDTVKYLNTLNIQGIKIHMLHILKNTALGAEYEKAPFPLLTRDAYVDITTSQIEHLDPNIVVHRVTGDAPKSLLIAPDWTLKKFIIMNEIDKKMRANKTYQGINYQP